MATRLDRALHRLAATHRLAYATKFGSAWLGDARKLMRRIPDHTINAIITSPPFALLNEKAYGNVTAEAYFEWFRPFAEQFHRILRTDGSLVIEIGGTWISGAPIRSLYHFELASALVRQCGFYLAQELFWVHENRIPTPASWVTVKRCRVKDDVTPIWWLSPSKFPKADNRRVLTPYKASFLPLMRKRSQHKHLCDSLGLDSRGKVHEAPSGYHLSKGGFAVDNGGAIPGSLIRCTGVASDAVSAAYFRYCKQHKFTVHPARFPADIPTFFIKLLTEPGDLVLDPFGGSNTTGELADSLQRRWLSFELSKEYLQASVGRFHPSRLVSRPSGLPRPCVRWRPPPGPKLLTKV